MDLESGTNSFGRTRARQVASGGEAVLAPRGILSSALIEKRQRRSAARRGRPPAGAPLPLFDHSTSVGFD
jgi:hypothetical protein